MQVFVKYPMVTLYLTGGTCCRSLLGNRLNGSIPKEIGNITTLKEL